MRVILAVYHSTDPDIVFVGKINPPKMNVKLVSTAAMLQHCSYILYNE